MSEEKDIPPEEIPQEQPASAADLPVNIEPEVEDNSFAESVTEA